jgi:hypothetical protein
MTQRIVIRGGNNTVTSGSEPFRGDVGIAGHRI